MSYQKILQNIHERLDDYRDREFTECDLESLVLALEAINEDLHDNSSDDEFAGFGTAKGSDWGSRAFLRRHRKARAS